MEKKKKHAPERKLTRTTIIALVVIVLASVAHPILLLLTRPDFMGEIIYPLVIRRALFFALTILTISIAALFLFKFVGKLGRVILIFVLLFNGFVAFIPMTPDEPFKLFLKQNNHTQWQDHVYYLAEFPVIPYHLHNVYECDSSGIVCRYVSTVSDNAEGIPQSEFIVSDDESELYVLIGKEQFLVATQSP